MDPTLTPRDDLLFQVIDLVFQVLNLIADLLVNQVQTLLTQMFRTIFGNAP